MTIRTFDSREGGKQIFGGEFPDVPLTGEPGNNFPEYVTPRWTLITSHSGAIEVVTPVGGRVEIAA